MSTLELRHLRKVFLDGTVAVDDVDIAIADGEFVAIVGPSGCGKTTVLRMVAGLEAPSDGEMYIDGELVNGQTAQQTRRCHGIPTACVVPPHDRGGESRIPIANGRAPPS